MRNWKDILGKIFWSLAATGLIVLFVFAWQAKTTRTCKAIQVELTGASTSYLFMNENEILHLINEQGVKVGTPIGLVNLQALEKYLVTAKWIQKAQLYFDNQQQLQVKIEQRIPIARIFTASQNSFYIDKDAQRLPLRQLSIMRLPVFTGFPSDAEKLSKPDSALLLDILQLAKIVQTDSFFNAQIAQVNIATNGDFELIPTLGDHTVLLGSMEHIEDKLNRLYTFYKKVWVPSGINAYQVLDLRFSPQVVALKKGMQPIAYAPGTKLLLNVVDPLSDSIPKQDSLQKKDTTATPKIIGKPSKPTTIVPSKNIISSKKTKLQPKLVEKNGQKTSPKKNNKSNNKTLINKNKTAKAEMPKKSDSNNN
jgi:cell division protein FtsQ